MQKHPWYQRGLPKGLQLDAYNSHYVELSKAAANSADLAAAIKKVMQVALADPSFAAHLWDTRQLQRLPLCTSAHAVHVRVKPAGSEDA